MTYINGTTMQKTFLTLFVGIGILFLQFFPSISYALSADVIELHTNCLSLNDGSEPEGETVAEFRCRRPWEIAASADAGSIEPGANASAQDIVNSISDEAQSAGSNPGGVTNPGSQPGGVTNPSTQPGGSKSIINPLKFDSIPEFLLAIIDILLTFAIPIIVLFIMYAGYLFATARGNEAQISTARNALLWAIVGGVIVLGAKVIISVIQGTVDAFK